jgi:hypothetical protein
MTPDYPVPDITSQYETKPPLLPEGLLDLELLLRLRLYFELALFAGAASGDLGLGASGLLDLDLDLPLLAEGLLPRCPGPPLPPRPDRGLWVTSRFLCSAGLRLRLGLGRRCPPPSRRLTGLRDLLLLRSLLEYLSTCIVG